MNGNNTDCSPGSHLHSDRPNWQPAETADEYATNVREGLEKYSERRHAKLLEVSRMTLNRWKKMAAIPEDLFNLLIATGNCSTKALAQIGQAFNGKSSKGEVECCPHCGAIIRFRRRWNATLQKVID